MKNLNTKTLKLFFLITFLIQVINIYSQKNESGIATYNIVYKGLDNVVNKSKKPKKELDIMSNSYFKVRKEEREKLAKHIEYKLEFTGNNSVFYMKDMLESENNRSLLFFKVGKIYTFGDEKLTKKTIYGEDFIITSKLSNVKWTLSKTKQKIGDFICYKATSVKIINNPKGTFKRNIVAWYCPDFNLKIGPKGYGGLLGLIIKLDIDNEGVYTLKKLILKPKKKIVIKKPKKGKIVTEEQFKKLSHNIFKKRYGL